MIFCLLIRFFWSKVFLYMLNKMNKGRFHIELWAYEQISRSVESGFEAWILDFSVHKLVRRLSLSIWHPIYLECILLLFDIIYV